MQIVTTNTDSVRALLPDWKAEIKTAIRDIRVLYDRLKLPIPSEDAIKAAEEFGVFVPESLLRRIAPGKIDDPVLKQILPISAEMNRGNIRFRNDPVGDAQAMVHPGLIHKYPGRILLICSGNCPVHCRYCFRRHFPYDERPIGRNQIQATIDKITSMDDVSEVILSGGDPLMIVDSELAWILSELSAIRQIKRLRIHSRFPTIIPSRITSQLVGILEHCPLAVTVVLHVNHPRELNAEVKSALERLRHCGCNLLNQSVLLRGVNDDIDTLVELSEELINLNVIPYYLNQLDRVKGSEHFEVPVNVGRRLVRQMRKQLPGYAVPRYVQDVVGHDCKQVLA